MSTTDEMKDLVQTAIQVKIVQAFNDAPEAIDMLVKAALSKEVNEYGSQPEYRDKKFTYLEYLVGDIIRRVAKESVTEAVKKRESEIKLAVQKAISADDLVTALTKAILGAVNEDYRVNINFASEKKEDDY